MKQTVQDDRCLLARCLNGEREASELFVRRFSGLIYHCVQRTLAAKGIPFSNQDLEDLHNTIFLYLFENRCRKLGQYQGKNGCSPASWLRVVAVRIVLNHLRDNRAHGALRQDEQAPFENLSDQDRDALGPLALMEQAERLRLLQGAIQRLSPRDRLFMRLYFEDGLGLEEVASALGISVQNAYTVKRRAVERIRSHLKR